MQAFKKLEKTSEIGKILHEEVARLNDELPTHIKLNQVEIMKEAAMLSAKWQLEAYSIIVPGKTTDAEVAKFLKMKMNI